MSTIRYRPKPNIPPLDVVEDLLLWLGDHGRRSASIRGGSLSDEGHAAAPAMLLNYGGFTPECSNEAETIHGGENTI